MVADSFRLSRRAILSEHILSSAQPRGWGGFSDSESSSLPPWLGDEEPEAEWQRSVNNPIGLYSERRGGIYTLYRYPFPSPSFHPHFLRG